MAARYTDAEKKLISIKVRHGVKVADVLKLLSNRTHWALKRQAQLLGYGVKTNNGIEYFTANKGTRVRKKKTTTVSETRATTNSSVSSVEKTNQSISSDIVAENDDNFTIICKKLCKVLEDKTLQVTNISANYEGMLINITKEAS